MKKIIVIFISLLFNYISKATNYYVDGNNGNNSNNGLTQMLAKKTIQAASDLTMPGDTVFIMNGTYNRTTWGSVIDFQRNGTPTAYITFKPFPGHNPIISASGGSWNAVLIDGTYVVLDGLEFEGNNANITLSAATQAFEDTRDGILGPQAAYNTNCMSIGSRSSAHHVIIRNCKVHDFPGGGIGVGGADYITIEKNKVYNNSWYTMYATSGISVFGPDPIDGVTSYKIIIRQNVVYNNKTQVPWYRGAGIQAVLSDGNGIILDANNGTQNKPIYTGRTLVENNVSYNNGGGGIHAFQAARVDIINNTAFNNGTIVGYPEIDANQCTDIKIYNNIMYARTGGDCNGNNLNTIYNYNMYFNGPAFSQGPNDIIANPQFINPTTLLSANFQLINTSPAINSGSNISGQFSLIDLNGITRPQGIKPDRGAYEYVGITVTANATNTSICQGQSVTLTGSGATSYTWTNGVTNGLAFTPSITATYTVTGTTGTVTNTSTITISVKPLPNIAAVASNSVICNGQQVTLTASGANTYTWTSGVTNGVAFTPSITATYTVTGTSNGCSKTATKTVSVNPLPNVTAISSNSIICNGQQVTLTASGASTYTWTNGITNGLSFTPSITATYTITGTSNGCSKSSTKTVSVNPLPNVTAVSSNSVICYGQSITLTASGTTTYTWTNGITNGVAFTPSSTATYTVTGNDFNGCSNLYTITIIVNTCTGLQKNTLEDYVKIYPNPTSGNFSINTAQITDRVIVTDVLGKEIINIIPETSIIDIQLWQYENGIYNIKIVSEKNTITKKIILCR